MLRHGKVDRRRSWSRRPWREAAPSDPNNTNLAIEEDGALAGMIASFTVEGDRELTYWIDPVRWGRGIASGAAKTFIQREAQRPLFARAAAHNLGSSKVLLRNGFNKVGEETSWAAGVGEHVLEYIYRLDLVSPADRSP